MSTLFTPRLNALLAAFVLSAATFGATSGLDGLRAQTGDGFDPDGGDDNHCGNAIVETNFGEQCDEGESNGLPGHCTTNCQWPSSGSSECGNGIVEGNELCDEGASNGTIGSACATCCILKPLHLKQELSCICGNEKLEWPEECDAGSRNGKGSSQCNRFCALNTFGDARCGNGQQEGDEECDDGNGSDTDRCTVECKKARCGDLLIQELGADGIEGTKDDEQCDLGSGNGTPISNCTMECKKKSSGGTDGTVGGDGESDDDDDQDLIDNQPFCGNGKQEGKEECDDGNLNNGDACTNRCRKPACRDGIPFNRSDEQCDDGNEEDGDECSNSCRKNFCGDAIRQDRLKEECDKGMDRNGTADSKCTRSCMLLRTTPNENGDAEVKRKAEEAKRIEELRKKREEAQRAAEQAREQGGIVEQRSDLLCFDAGGDLVNDRKLCDPDQSKFVRGGAGDLSEQKAKEEIRKDFLGSDVEERHRAKLLELMRDGKIRIEVLLRNNDRDQSIRTYLEQASEWLGKGIAYFETPRNLDEVQQMVAPVKQLLAQITGLIQQDKNLPKEKVDINPIVKKTETLLLKFRESFIALAQAGVELDQNALESYVDAVELFNATANACAEDELACASLSDVLDLMKDVQEPLMEDLNAHPDILKAVEAKF